MKQAFTKRKGNPSGQLHINKSSIQQMIQKGMKPYSYQHRVVEMLQEENYDAHVEMYESLLRFYQNDFGIIEAYLSSLLKMQAKGLSAASLSKFECYFL